MLRSVRVHTHRRPPRPALVVPAAVALVLGVAYLDWLTGPELVMGQFYLLPIALTTAIMGYRSGMLMTVLTVAIWGVAEVMGAAVYSHKAMLGLNAILRFLYLAFVVWLLSVWRVGGELLESQVRERTAALEAEVAERRQAEAALHALALKLSDAEDAERRRLAHDIHDTVGQSLTLLKMRMQSAVSFPGGGRRATANDDIALLAGAVKQLRTLVFELHPPMLDDLGLVPALRGLARELERQASVEITVAEEGSPRSLAKPLAGYLFRTIKELISNAITHGGSTEIVVTFYWLPGKVRATVDDNGGGFDAAAAPQGLGLAGIRERAFTLGGTINIESGPGRGTRVILNLPLT